MNLATTLYSDNEWLIAIMCTAVVVGNLANYTVSRKIYDEQCRLYPEAFAV